MKFSLHTNTNAQHSQRHLRSASKVTHKRLRRLATGTRIHSAQDDSAGLSITNRMTAHIKEAQKAKLNAETSISFSQTLHSVYQDTVNHLQQMRTLILQGSQSTLQSQERQNLQNEIHIEVPKICSHEI